MELSKLFELVAGAAVAYLVPWILDRVLKRPAPKSMVPGFPWLYWCLAHAIGGGVGGVLSAGLGASGMNTPGGVANWTAYGASLGIAQWFVLQRYWRITPFWAVASALGWAVHALSPSHFGWMLAGLAVGILQWPILRKNLAGAFWWIPVNAVAWLIAFLISFPLGLAMQSAGISFASVWIIGWSLVGLFGGIIIGFVMVRMPALST